MIAIVVTLLGRGLAGRLGRVLYMQACGEKPRNAIEENGEQRLIENVLEDWPGGGSPILLLAKYAALAQVRLQALAPSSREGTAEFSLADEAFPIHSIELGSLAHGASTISVTLTTGAAFAAEQGISRIALAKIDTEGNDSAVVEGLSALLEEYQVDIVQFEYNSRWLAARRSLRVVFELAARVGYRVGRIMPDEIEMFPSWNPECDRFFEVIFALIREKAWARYFAEQGVGHA